MKKPEWKMPAEVLAVRSEIEAWRAKREKRAPVPSKIWSAATSLAVRYSVHRISQALRLNYGALKRRVVELSEESGRSSLNDVDGADCHFVEISGAGMMTATSSRSSASTADCGAVAMEVEVRDGAGAHMTVRVSNGSGADLLGLVDSFWSRGQ